MSAIPDSPDRPGSHRSSRQAGLGSEHSGLRPSGARRRLLLRLRQHAADYRLSELELAALCEQYVQARLRNWAQGVAESPRA